MKKFILTITAIFICIGAHGKTETINWYMDGNTYATTQCETGSDIILPQTPYKYGYTFNGWFGYTPIEYLESTGTQYIDTGFIPNIGTKFEIRVQQTSSNADMNFGGVTSQAAINFASSYFSPLVTQNSKCIYYFNSYHITDALCRVNDIITASIYVMPTQAQIIQNNETLNAMNTYSAQGIFEPTNSVYLFAGHGFIEGKNTINTPATARIFYAKIWDNDILVRDFIPVLDGNGTPCMYDKVEKKFYYNAGTGDFIAGPVIGE